MRIAELKTPRLRLLAQQARTDPLLLISLLGLSTKEGPKQCARVNAALGISKKDRALLLKTNLNKAAA